MQRVTDSERVEGAPTEEIRARLSAATGGSWQVHELHVPHRLAVRTTGGTIWVACGALDNVDQDNADAVLLAHAPDDLRSLLRQAQTLREAFGEVAEAVRRAEDVLWLSDAVMHEATREAYEILRRSLTTQAQYLTEGGVS